MVNGGNLVIDTRMGYAQRRNHHGPFNNRPVTMTTAYGIRWRLRKAAT